MKLKIAVIFGSRTCEHDVSIISGMQAAAALDKEQYSVERVYISRDGGWYAGPALSDMKFYEKPDFSLVTKVYPAAGKQKLRLMRANAKKKLFSSEEPVYGEYDVAMPVMHGLNGEDGTLQGMLELFNVPYTSAGVMGSAVGMDKITQKLVLKGAGLPVLDSVWFERSDWDRNRAGLLDKCEKELKYPMFVKPANLGSSIGITRAVDRESLEDAIDTACAYDRRILVEQGVEAPRELNCSVLGYAGDIKASPLEMPVSNKEMLTFPEKYLRGEKGTKGMQSLARQVPAPVSDEITKSVQAMACDIFAILDLKGVVRIDFLLDKDDNIYVNEANIIPGSLAFYLWEADGLKFSKMLDQMVECAFRAHADKNQSVYSYDSSILQKVISGAKGAKGSKM